MSVVCRPFYMYDSSRCRLSGAARAARAAPIDACASSTLWLGKKLVCSVSGASSDAWLSRCTIVEINFKIIMRSALERTPKKEHRVRACSRVHTSTISQSSTI